MTAVVLHIWRIIPNRYCEQKLVQYILLMPAYRDIAQQLKLPGSEGAQVDTCQLVSNWLDKVEGCGWLITRAEGDGTGKEHPGHTLYLTV
jgi:hypothetical protein